MPETNPPEIRPEVVQAVYSALVDGDPAKLAPPAKGLAEGCPRRHHAPAPGSGRTVHKSRYVAAAIKLRQQARAAARTPEQDAILAQLPRVPRAEIEACRTPAGGYSFTRERLATWGIPWPPPPGWRQALERGQDGGDAA